MRYFFKFCLVGLSNTLLGLGVIYFCWRVLSMSDVSANMVGYAVGLLWGYTLNRQWTFRSVRRGPQRFGRYLLVCISAYATNLGLIGLMRHVLGYQDFFPHVVGSFLYTSVSYLGCRYFVFVEERQLATSVMQEVPRKS